MEVYEKAIATIEKGINKEEILKEASIAETDEEKEKILGPLIKFESAEKIVEVIVKEPEILLKPKEKKKRRKFYDFQELKNEIERHQVNLSLLELKKFSIKEVLNPDTSSFDERIGKLQSLLLSNKINDKVELSDFTVSAFDMDFKQLEKLLSEKSALKRYKTREKEKIRQKERYEKNIKKELNHLETLIGQSKLDDAKLLVNKLSKSISPDYKKGIERLSKAVIELEKKELEIFKKRQAELLRKQQEDAEIISRIEAEKKSKILSRKEHLFEVDTEYEFQLNYETAPFSCHTLLRYKRNYDVHDNLNRGVALLEGDKELRQYIHSFGNMHVAKLKDAFQLLISTTHFNQSANQIEIFDWGCGQGIGSIAIIDQLRIYKNKHELIDKISLIEPGIDALKRASLNCSKALNSQNKIKPINKFIGNSLTKEDLENQRESVKYHIFSNILDINEIDTDHISKLITTYMKGINYIVCVGPRFGDSRDKKMEYFTSGFKFFRDYEIISKRENGPGWKHHNRWTRKEIIIKLNL